MTVINGQIAMALAGFREWECRGYAVGGDELGLAGEGILFTGADYGGCRGVIILRPV